MSPKQQRGRVTAEALLDAALSVYSSAGEQGLTVEAVTRTSGVSLGSLYHHFGSLDGLLAALTQRWLERLVGDVSTALVGARTARSGIRALVHAYLGFVAAHRDAALLLHSSAADRYAMAHGRELRDAQEARLSPIGAWTRARVEAGELAALPPAVIESLVLGPVTATARRWLSGAGDVDPEEAARILADRIWRSVRP